MIAPVESAPIADLEQVRAVAARIRARIRDAVIGRDDVIELVLVARRSSTISPTTTSPTSAASSSRPTSCPPT
jgi:hypothetical protein